MTMQELDQLLEDTRRLPRVEDRVGHHTAIAIIEIARQLVLLNQKLGGGPAPKAVKNQTVKKKKR